MRAPMQPNRRPRVFLTFALAGVVQFAGPVTGRAQSVTNNTNQISEAKISAGFKLFDHNCAHCHGDDARGDEGPDLHGLRKTDARIEKLIKEGVKGEMPAFGKKFTDDEVKELVGYLRTLKN
jgi:mono/diheme cytochrome c family protein